MSTVIGKFLFNFLAEIIFETQFDQIEQNVMKIIWLCLSCKVVIRSQLYTYYVKQASNEHHEGDKTFKF